MAAVHFGLPVPAHAVCMLGCARLSISCLYCCSVVQWTGTCVYWDELVVLVHTNFLAPPSQRVCPTEPQVDGGAIAAEYMQCSPVDGCVYWDELVVLVHTNFLAQPSQRVCPTEPQVDGGAIAAEYSVVQWTGVYIGRN